MKQLKYTLFVQSAPLHAFCKNLKLDHSRTKKRLFEKDRTLARVQGTVLSSTTRAQSQRHDLLSQKKTSDERKRRYATRKKTLMILPQ